MASSEKLKEGWKNPNDIMRIHRIQRRNSKSNLKTVDTNSGKNSIPQKHSDNSKLIPSSLNDKKPDINPFKKRSNTFGCEQDTPAKHMKVENELEWTRKLSTSKAIEEKLIVSESAQSNTDCRTEQEQHVSNKSQGKHHENVLSEIESNLRENNVTSSDYPGQDSENIKKVFPSMPLDWSLKAKMRVVTNMEVNTKGKCPGLDARNVHGFVHSQYNDEEWRGMDILSQIRRCCYHYCFPSIPCMNKFPRLSSHYGTKISPLNTSQQDILEALQSEWSKAFISVYQQLRSSLCPYFYVCTHQFTVLFRCLRSESKCTLSAFLSPSTRGLRELLKKEGVSFHMPGVKQHSKETKESKERKEDDDTDIKEDFCSGDRLRLQDNSQTNEPQLDKLDCAGDCSEGDISKRNKSIVTPSGTDDDDDDEENDTEDDDINCHEDEAASSWLEEIGLESKHFPSLLPQNVKAQKERFQDIDNRPQSVLYMEGLNVHAFFNFLLNYPSCIANSGPQYGLPPTILSPSPFQGGTLTLNMVKQSAIQDASSNKKPESSQVKEKSYVLEINGPILPHHTLNIAAILQSRATSSSLSFSVHQPTTAFNTEILENLESNIMLSGMNKLLVPFSSLEIGLLPMIEVSLLSEESLSTREVNIQKRGVTCLS